jgi:hypothetical protein
LAEFTLPDLGSIPVIGSTTPLVRAVIIDMAGA